MRIDYEQDKSTMKTCYCESFKHDPEAILPATGETICALEGPSSNNSFVQDSILQNASLTPLAFKKKATSLLAFTRDQIGQVPGAAKDITVVMSPFVRSAIAKNIVRSLTRTQSTKGEVAAQ